MWGDNGITFIEPINVLEPAPHLDDIKLSDENDVVVLFNMSNKRHPKLENAFDTLKAMRINNLGNYVWENEKIIVSENNSYKARRLLSDYCSDKWIAVWEDARNSMSTSDFDIYAQNINDDGTLGNKPDFVNDSKENNNLYIYPNPSEDFIYINSDYEFGNILISNIFGEILINKEIINNNNSIDIKCLPSGTYLCSVRNGNNIQIKRFSVLR